MRMGVPFTEVRFTDRKDLRVCVEFPKEEIKDYRKTDITKMIATDVARKIWTLLMNEDN